MLPLHTMTALILPLLQPPISFPSQSCQLSVPVREEETITFAHKTSLRVTRSSGLKPLKAIPRLFPPHRRLEILPPGRHKAEQCLLSRLTTVAGANCGGA
jgi:hypothetical protein